LVNSDLADRPLDRALFAAFAELVRFSGDGQEGSEQTAQGYILARKP
jgi:hypothetical protein